VLTLGSVKMYKTKIREWQLQKNYKSAEKQAVLDFLGRLEPTASDVQIQIRGRPAKMHRIFRYSKARGIVRADAAQGTFFNRSVDPTVYETRRRLVKLLQHHNKITTALTGDTICSFYAPEGPLWSLAKPQDIEDAEATFFEASNYFRAYFNPSETFQKRNKLRSQPFFGQSLLSDIVDTYARACHEAAILNYRRARILLNRVHRQLHLATHAEGSQLLGVIFTIINTPSHNPKFETADLFGRFAMDLCCAVFGTGHAITKAIQRYCRMSAPPVAKEEFIVRFLLMRLEIARASLGGPQSASHRSTFMRCFGVNGIQYAKRLEEAVCIAESEYEPDHAELLTALHEWAAFHLREINALYTAERGFKKVLATIPGQSRDKMAIHARLRALKGLVVIADRQSRWDEGEALCREALDISIKELGQTHYYTIRLGEWLMDLLSQQGREEEAQQIAVDNGLEVECDLE
jgi:hypothetical protein